MPVAEREIANPGSAPSVATSGWLNQILRLLEAKAFTFCARWQRNLSGR